MSFFHRKQNEFGESPNSLQTLSKLKKNMRAKTFLPFLWTGCTHIFREENLCTHIFLSLERVWRFSKSGAHANKGKNVKIDIKQTFPCELQTLSKLICSVFVIFFLWERKEWAWIFSKLFRNSLELGTSTHKKSYVFLWSEVETFKVLLRVWSEFGDSPNSLQTQMFSVCSCYFFFAHFSGGKGVSFKHQHTHKKKKHVFHVAQNISIFILFCGRKVKFSKFGCELRVWIQVHSKIT